MQKNKDHSTRTSLPIEDLVGLFRTILTGKSAYYIALPITGGTRFQRWYHDEGSKIASDLAKYQDERYNNVILPNQNWFRKRHVT